jgi:predicted acetyltransferase
MIRSFVWNSLNVLGSIKRQPFVSRNSTASFKSTFSTHSQNVKQEEYKFEFYEKLYEKSLKEPEEFWGKFAKDIHWSPFTTYSI